MSDTGGPAGASDGARGHTLRWGLITSVIQRGVGALIPLVSVPLALGHLGAVNYGAWATAVALTTVFAFSDLGIGTGLMTRLGGSFGGSTPTLDDRALVSSAYAMVAGVVLALLVGLGLVATFTDMADFLGAGQGGNVELILCVTLAAFVISIWVSLVVRVQYAVGQQTASNIWQTVGSLAMFAGIWCAAEFTEWPGWFILAAVAIPVVVTAVNSCWFFGFTPLGKALAPIPRLADLALAGSLLRLGARFLLVSLLLAASVAVDPWIVARTTDLAEVPNFSIPSRLLSVVGLISVMALMPLWPMHARAVQEGDVVWIQRMTRRLVILSTSLMAVVVTLVVLSSQFLVEHWLGDAITVNYVLWSGLAVLCVAQAMTGPLFMVQNGAEVLGPQTVGYALLFGTVLIKWWLAMHVGYQWISWVTAGAYVMFVMPACWIGYRRALDIARGRVEVAVG